ncbi:MAG: winged helix-turn-helix domain-containing protein [Tissierellia bacterium]|nr:winged helix-turn-helix domain-containing protein [Tissierellia bacterium]
MKHRAKPNLLMEAIAYLGNRANVYKIADMESRLKDRNVSDLTEFHEQFKVLKGLIHAMDRDIRLPQKTLERYFKDLPGFPFNSIGGYSLGFLLLYPVEEPFYENLEKFLEYKANLSQEEVCKNLLLALDFKDEIQEGMKEYQTVFLSKVLSMEIASDTKLQILDLQARYKDHLMEVSNVLRPVLGFLMEHRAKLESMAETFLSRLDDEENVEYVQEIMGLSDGDKDHIKIIPFVLGADTNLLVDHVNSKINAYVYAGVLRDLLKKLMYSRILTTDNVYDCVKLLGDRTRFDILLFLKQKDAYSSDLVEELKLARTTIHHHMTKLIDADLVAPIVDGNKVMYRLNREKMSELLNKQREFLLGD